MRPKANPKLPFNLPASDKNEVFQIISDGGIRKHSSKQGVWEIKIYLQGRYIEGKKSLYGDIIERWININQSPLLKIGSLWSKDGRLLTKNIYTETKNFSINPEINGKETTLNRCFEKFSFIGNLMNQDLMTRIREKKPYWGFKVSEDSFVIISCSELLRFLIYRGPATIQYLFTHTNDLGKNLEIHDLCVPVQEPSPENLYTLKVILNGYSFSNPDIRILSELSISNHLNQEAKRVHNEFIVERYIKGNLNDNTDELYVKFNPKNLGRQFDFEASGLEVSYGNKNYFLVTSINRGGGLYTYKDLKFEYQDKEVRKTKEQKNDSEEEPKIGVQFVAKYNPQNMTIDDNEEGHNMLNIMDVYVDNDDDVYDLPSMKEDQNIIERDSTNTKKRCFQISPEILSGRLGGNDLRIGGIHADYDTGDSGNGTSTEEISQEEFFKKVLKKFQEEESLDVKCLNFNNENDTYGAYLSVFPKNHLKKKYYTLSDDTQRKFGLIEIKLDDGCYFYYVQIFDSRKRAGFIYKSNLDRFTEKEFNDIILSDIAESNILGDWYHLSQEYLDCRVEMKKSLQFYVIAHARNTKNIAKIPSSCIRDINEFYRL